MVYDTYLENSLKGMTRKKRETGTRRKVTSSALAPTNSKGFLRVVDNKTELFRFLSEKIHRISDGDIISAFDDTVTSKPVENVVQMADHEEADTPLFLHVIDMSHKGIN